MSTLPLVSVVMPTFEQCHFIRRALDSLLEQTLTGWELIVVDDGSRDATARALHGYRHDPRIHCIRLPHNHGLGHALNTGLDHARAPLLAYLPSDDVIYRDHLQDLHDCLTASAASVLAYAGMRHHGNRYVHGQLAGHALQLVQCMHRRTALRWTVRAELESDDLERLFWNRLRFAGAFEYSGAVTCEWVDHPLQRHKLMQEPHGGINRFRRHYRVATPLRFHASTGNAIDEAAQYAEHKRCAPCPPADGGLRIVLAGELAYNADRVLALEEHGHQLYGLWMDDPHFYNTVGPLHFGQVRDLPRHNWRDVLPRLKPDLIYAQLNWQAVPFAHAVMQARAGIPFVWHFKEGPFICMQQGSWPQLVELVEHADGCIFASDELRDWFDTVLPGVSRARPTLVLDGDLPRRTWFERTPAAPPDDGEVHTVVPGRPIGLHPPVVAQLAAHGIHLHFYGDFTHGQWRAWIEEARALAPHHLHLHGHVDPARWVDEFSRYTAGWLHCFDSANQGDIRRAVWDDLNLPARLSTLAAAGVPMIQRRNDGAVVAAQSLVRRFDIGVFYDSVPELAEQLRDRARMAALRANLLRHRAQFTFDHHVPELLAFFRRVIGARRA